MRKFLLKIILLILLPLVALDLYYRTKPEAFRWYAQVEKELRDDETNIFFVGSSRTLLAIDADRATAELRKGPIPNAHVYNLGGPYSTVAEHALGLRNLIEDRPAAMRGSLWLFETLYGLPERRSTWNDSWVNPDHKEFLLNVLRARDLSRFWATGGLGFFDKAYISTAYFSRFGRSFLDTRVRLIMVGERAVDRWIKRLAPEEPASPAPPRDSGLATGTPVRTDEAGIQFARQLALAEASAARTAVQKPYGDWERQVVYDWVHEISAAGGSAYFFDIPLSSVQSEAFLTPLRREDSRRFGELARSWGVRPLPLQPSYSDEDFPDLIHLRKSRRDEYTDSVVREISEFYRR